ncbi:MAG: hypothetical protein R3B51_07110 [Thermodesulfobacteriota bacterium]
MSGVIELEDKDKLDIKTGAASIDLGQIYSWLGEFKGFGPHLKDLGTVTGRSGISVGIDSRPGIEGYGLDYHGEGQDDRGWYRPLGGEREAHDRER